MKNTTKSTLSLAAAVAVAGFTLTTPSADAALIDILGEGGGITASSDYYNEGNPGMWMTPGVIDGNGLVSSTEHSQIAGSASAGTYNM